MKWLTPEASPELLETLVDTIPDSVAVLDASFAIVGVNAGWMRFARNEGGQGFQPLGVSYLDICAKAADGGDEAAARAFEGLKAVGRGALEQFQLDYECSSPTRKRWFTMLCTRAGDHIVVVHRDTTVPETIARHVEADVRDLLAVATRDRAPVLAPTNISDLWQDLVRATHPAPSDIYIMPDVWAMADATMLVEAFQGLLAESDAWSSLHVGGTETQVVMSLRVDEPAGDWDGFDLEPLDWRGWDGGLALPYVREVVQIHNGALLVWGDQRTIVQVLFPRMPAAPSGEIAPDAAEYLQP